MGFRSKPLKGIKKGSTAFKRGVEQATIFYDRPENLKWHAGFCRMMLTIGASPTPTGYGDPIIDLENSHFEADFWAGWQSVSKLLGYE
jgi:hypothetical protein